MAETRHPVSDIMLARYVAGDLHGAQRERIERAIHDTPGVAERVDRIKRDRDAFLKDNTPEAFAHRIVTRITVEKKPRHFWQVWWMLPPVGVATALLIGVFANRAIGPQEFAPAEVTTDDQAQVATQAAPAWKDEARAEKAKEGKPSTAIADDKADDEGAAKALLDRQQRTEALADAPAGTGRAANPKGGGASAKKDALSKVAKSETRDLDDFASGVGASGGAVAPGIGQAGSAGDARREFAKAPPPPTITAPAAEPAPAEKPGMVERSAPAKQPALAPRARADIEVNAKATGIADADKSAKAGNIAPVDEAEPKARTVTGRGAPSSTITINQGGSSKSVTGSTTVMAGTPLEVTAKGGQWVTIVGVRPNGQLRTYTHAKIPATGSAVVGFVLLPTTRRIPEALFVVISDTALGTINADTARDSNKLPLRLAVDGSQRRVVINVTPGL